MAVSVLITNREVFNQYGNGLDYSLNPADTTTYLRGGVMGVQKVVYTVEVAWASVANVDTGVEFLISTGNRLSRNSGDWIEEGFSIGDTIDLDEPGVGNIFLDRVITNITETLIIFDGAAVPPAPSYDNAVLYGGKTDLHGLEYSFGIIENNAVNDEYKYLLDNTDQTYYADNFGLGGSTNFVNLQAKSENIQGWDSSRVGESKVKFVSRTTYVQTFEIHHEYIINPYIFEALLAGNKSFKYISKFDFRINVNNVNTSKVQLDQLQLGSVGWFDENYNGYINDFNISDLVYTDVASASVVTELNIKSKTRVEFTVNSDSGLFTATDPLIAIHSFIPSANQYSKQPDKFREIWIFESARALIDGGASNNGSFTRFEVAFVSVNEVTVIIEIELSAPEQSRLIEGDTYRLGMEAGDGDTANQTLNVTLSIDENTYTEDSNITDLIIDVPSEGGFAPTYKFLSPANELFTTIFGWNEDDNKSVRRFGVNRTAAKDAQILGAKFKIVAYEDATGETFDLQNEQLDLDEQLAAPAGTVSANPWTIQLIEDARTRGYRLPSGDESNLLLWETKNNDGTYQYYEWRVGFKMNWQYWLSLPNADKIFIVTSDSFNGLNNRASNYSLKNGWSIRVIYNFDMQGLDDEGNIGTTTKNFITQAFSIFDFGEQDNDPATWDCLTETFDSEGNLLGQAVNGVGSAPILSNEVTFIKDTYTPQAPFIISDITPYWAEIRIAEENQQGFNNDVLNTTKPYLTNNRIIPLEGDSFAKISLVANTIVVECRTNLSQIKPNITYKTSARLANQDEPIPLVQWIFKTESDIPTDAPFDPFVMTVGGEVPTWTLIEGYNQVTTAFTKSDRTSLGATELDGTCQSVVVTFSTNDASNVTEIDMNDDNICDVLDLAIFDSLTSIEAATNPLMIGFTQPTSATSIIDFIALSNTGIVGVLDLSNIDKLEGSIILNNCPAMTGVTFASAIISGGNINILRINSCNITGTLDLSKLTKLGKEIRFNHNSLLTGVTFPPTIDAGASNITNIILNNCDVTGALDLSMFTKIGGEMRTQANFNMTSIAFAATLDVGANAFTLLRVNSCDLTGTLDLSVLTNLGGTIEVHTNPNLTDVTMPTTTNVLISFEANDCDLGHVDLTGFATSDNVDVLLGNNNMTAAEVNEILVDLDGTGWVADVASTISIAGTNAAPDGTSGGFDGLTAKANLQAKGITGFTVVTN